METARETRVVVVSYECDVCGSGRMVAMDHWPEMTAPPRYMHQCSSCNHLMSLPTKYPEYRTEVTDPAYLQEVLHRSALG